jgi:glycosyltransferase involved in cell wall biosynthesis
MRIYWYAPFNNASELEVAAHIARREDELLVQSLRSRFGQALPTEANGFELLRDLPESPSDTESGPTRRARATVAVRRALFRHRAVADGAYDIVHLHTVNPFTDWPAAQLMRRRASRLVLSVHNVRPHDRRMPRALETRVLGGTYRLADHLFVAHQRLADQLFTEFAIDLDRVTILPLPVPQESEIPRDPVQTDASVALFFGTFRLNKGMDVLLKAISQLPLSTAIRFHFAGRGEATLERAVAEAAALDPRVTAEIGYITHERRRELYRAADLIVLPYSSFSAQSGVLRDALAFRVPVIASDTGALGSDVRDERLGWVVPVRHASALAAALLDASKDRDAREAIRARMAGVAAGRSPERIASRMRQTYDAVPSREMT